MVRAAPAILAPPPAQPITRWEAIGDPGGITSILDLAGAAAVERAAYIHAPDSFTTTEGEPLGEDQPFEELAEAEAVIRHLGALGRTTTEIGDTVRALRAALPLFDRRAPRDWSASEVMAACARLLDMGAGPASAARLCAAAWALWTALDRPERVAGASAVMRALEEAHRLRA